MILESISMIKPMNYAEEFWANLVKYVNKKYTMSST